MKTLARLRRKLCLTQAELAAHLGVSRSFVSAVETGFKKLTPELKKTIKQLKEKAGL